jgi:hypothetical protein
MTEHPQQPLTDLEKAIINAGKHQKRKVCYICGQPEGSSGDGQNRRMVHTANNRWACNYCHNQGTGQ